MLDENELLFDELYEKTKDCGRVQFINLLMEKERVIKELKKQLSNSHQIKKQQKEFIEWLESEIKECKDAEEKYADGDDNSYYNNNELRIEILSKYKEIIGGKE